MSSRFATPLIVSEAEGSRWQLYAPLAYVHSLFEIVVPVGFDTDFASVPRLLWPLLPPQGRHSKAAVVHDWLYRHRVASRGISDRIFYDAMIDSGVKRWRAYLMWLGLRVGGWVAWKRNGRNRG